MGKTVKRKRKTKTVKRLPPTSREARDEGPRRLPLSEPAADSSRLERYLKLADSAMGPKKSGGSS